VAAAGLAGYRLGAGFRAFAIASLTALESGNANLGFRAARRVFECDLEVVAQVGAAIDVGPCASTTAEDLAEDVAKCIGKAAAEASSAGCACMRLDPGVSEAIVCRAPLRVA